MSISELSNTIQRNDVEAVKRLLENEADLNSYRTEISADDEDYEPISRVVI